ncbi:MAG: hypothetical protein R3282_08640, partial [Rhodothermales bacterium]|nr:hypothetical protein [Rhodothermales bacterium]
VRCLNGVFGQRIRTGDFYRFDLYRTTDGGELERTFRRSDVVRLHVPEYGASDWGLEDLGRGEGAVPADWMMSMNASLA